MKPCCWQLTSVMMPILLLPLLASWLVRSMAHLQFGSHGLISWPGATRLRLLHAIWLFLQSRCQTSFRRYTPRKSRVVARSTMRSIGP